MVIEHKGLTTEMAPKKKNRTQEMMYNEAQQMLQDSDNTDNSEPTKITEMNPSNADVLQAIKEMDKRVANTIDGVI